MYPSLPYFDIQVIEGQRDLGVGYIFLVLHNLYLVPVHKVLSKKYFRKYASLLSHDFRIFTSLGE